MDREVKDIYLYLLTRRMPSSIATRVTSCRYYNAEDKEINAISAYIRKYTPSRYYRDPKVRIIK